MSTDTPLLQVEALRVHFPDGRRRRSVPRRVVRAVDGVDLHVAPGETVGLVGESGCGKSTLARAVVRLLEPTGGAIRVDGHDVTHLPARQLRDLRRQVRIVFQDPYASLNPRRTVAENVARPLEIQRGRSQRGGQDRVMELLELVGLEADLARRMPHQLSGGQRQRVGIARALVLEPRLVVLDEPVSSLDVSVQAQVLALLARLQRELGVAYLFIAHDLAAIRQLSDRVAVMYLGQLVEHGDRDHVFRDPQHPYTQALLSAVPVADPTRARQRRRIVLRGELPDPADPPTGCRFRTRCWRVDEVCLADPPLREVAGRRVACHHPGT